MNFINFRNFQTLQTTKKLGLWLILTLAFSIIFFRDFWVSLPAMLSPTWVLEHRVSPWAVLALCLTFLWLKRKEVWRGMLEGQQVRGLKGSGWGTLQTFKPSNLLGVAMVVGTILMPPSSDYSLFWVLLMSLGIFIIIFGKAAKVPSILLAIYGFTIYFPLAIERFAQYVYSRITIVPMVGLMTTLGYPIQNEGQWVHFTSDTGESITVAIDAGCAGPATMGVFIALFALMMLDMPLSPKKAAGLFLFGMVGTWFQNFIRLIILLLLGFYLGKDALWTAHLWAVYILFPPWYFLFAYIYFRQVRRPLEVREKQKFEHTLVRGT